jgi:transitional endoplasmic reticulum ATPase
MMRKNSWLIGVICLFYSFLCSTLCSDRPGKKYICIEYMLIDKLISYMKKGKNKSNQYENGPSMHNLLKKLSSDDDKKQLNDDQEKDHNKVFFKDIVGIDNVVGSLKEILDFMKNPNKYTSRGAQMPKGVLLEGPPGVGKTMIARALANEVDCNFKSVTASDFDNVYVGVGASRVRELFQYARENKPCVIFIDEIDSIGLKRSSSTSREVCRQTINQILCEMDGFNVTNNILVVAATNDVNNLDKALVRPGRFDRIISVRLPGYEARLKTIKHFLQKIPSKISVSEKCLCDIAKKIEGFSFADIKNLLNESILLSIRKEDKGLSDIYIMETCEKLLREKSLREKNKRGNYCGDCENKILFKDIVGIDNVVDSLKEIMDFMKNPNKYTSKGAQMPKGVLIEGPPGVGKTMIAKAIANEAGCNFTNVSASEFEEMYVGVGAARVRELFEYARNNKPSIIFIDEIDSIGLSRSLSGNCRQTINQILCEMDGFDNANDVLVIAATNDVKKLDKALIRPGRFDRIISIKLPNFEGRLKTIEHFVSKMPIKNMISKKCLCNIARRMEGFSFADIKNLINESILLSIRKKDEVVKDDHIIEAYKRLCKI